MAPSSTPSTVRDRSGGRSTSDTGARAGAPFDTVRPAASQRGDSGTAARINTPRKAGDAPTRNAHRQASWVIGW
jgi:hypothetical protein